MLPHSNMFLVVLGLFALAGVSPWLHGWLKGRSGWVLAIGPAAAFFLLMAVGGPVVSGEAWAESRAWIPEFGVTLAFRLDGLALLMALLITGIGALVVVYSGAYLRGHPGLGRFYPSLLVFMGAMLGVVLADDLILLAVFWELTSISSYFLIGFEHDREAARAAALKALLVTGAGGLAMLAGFVLLGAIGGTFQISELLDRGDLILADARFVPALVLILAGAFTKSAQFPFYGWLPSAMEAPAPVSTYLHAATMVKAGVYLLARLHPIFASTELWWWALVCGGSATALVGGVRAVMEVHLKKVLAFSTVSALGLMVLMLGIGSQPAAHAAVAFLLAHALYKGTLFLVAGAVDHEAGESNVEKLGGLREKLPRVAAAAALSALSMAALPPFFGFIAKEAVVEAALGSPAGLAITLVAGVSGALFVTVALLIGWRPFWGSRRDTPKEIHPAPIGLWLPAAVLAVAGTMFGLVPGAVDGLVAAAAESVLDRPVDAHLKLWHGWNLALLVSGASVVAGGALYAARSPFRRAAAALGMGAPRTGHSPFDHMLKGLRWVSDSQTVLLQSGYLRTYVLVTLVTAFGLVGTAFFARAEIPLVPFVGPWSPHELMTGLLIVVAAVVATRARTRLTAIAAMGGVGYGVALIYVLFGAPDLALTQIAVETLTVILFVLAFRRLPRFSTLSSWPVRVRDVVFSLLAGATVTALILATNALPDRTSISGWFAEHSVPAAHGRNIVNVILVDFRALDTLGEITVLAVAGFGVYALLNLRLKTEAKP